MIKAVRLREPNKQKGWTLKRFMSPGGTLYQAGSKDVPSALVIVDDPAEIDRLRQVSDQFEILEVSDRNELDQLVQKEMETRVREEGGSAVRAAVEERAPKKAEELYEVTTPTLTPTITSTPKPPPVEPPATDEKPAEASSEDVVKRVSRRGRKPTRRS